MTSAINLEGYDLNVYYKSVPQRKIKQLKLESKKPFECPPTWNTKRPRKELIDMMDFSRDLLSP